MQKRWLSVLLIMLWLLLGAAIVLAQTTRPPAGANAPGHTNRREGGFYTLNGTIPTTPIEERGTIRPSSAERMRGGAYALTTTNGPPGSRISPLSQRAAAAVVTRRFESSTLRSEMPCPHVLAG